MSCLSFRWRLWIPQCRAVHSVVGPLCGIISVKSLFARSLQVLVLVLYILPIFVSIVSHCAAINMSEYEEKSEKDSRSASRISDTNIVHKSKAEEDVEVRGRIAGGKYLELLGENDSTNASKDWQLTKVEFDLPLTITTTKHHEGEEIILLSYADGDKENPFNWSLARKRLITMLLCGMTLFIGMY